MEITSKWTWVEKILRFQNALAARSVVGSAKRGECEEIRNAYSKISELWKVLHPHRGKVARVKVAPIFIVLYLVKKDANEIHTYEYNTDITH